jgi:hypothetical protein
LDDSAWDEEARVAAGANLLAEVLIVHRAFIVQLAKAMRGPNG